MNILLDTLNVPGIKREKILKNLYFFNITDYLSHLLSRYISSFESFLLYVWFSGQVIWDLRSTMSLLTNYCCFERSHIFAHEFMLLTSTVLALQTQSSHSVFVHECKKSYYNFFFHALVSAARFIFSPTLNETGNCP